MPETCGMNVTKAHTTEVVVVLKNALVAEAAKSVQVVHMDT